MGLGVGVSHANYYDFGENNFSPNLLQANQINSSANQKPKIPAIPQSVTFTALGCDTEQKLARASYMAAAAKAGIADVDAQLLFADSMLENNRADLVLTNEKLELDDAKVRSRLLNREVNFTLSDNEKNALRNFRQQYINNGGKIRGIQNPTIDLRQAQSPNGVTLPTNSTPNTKFRVLLNNNGNPITDRRVLAQLAENQYKGGNLWGQNYLQIADMSLEQGVNLRITGINRIGNKIAVDFEISLLDRAKVHENYKIVQDEVNKAVAAYENFANDNEVSSFLRGVFNGAVKSLKGTLNLILDLPGTMKALWQVVTHPVETFNNLINELSQTWDEFKKAPPNKKAEMLGELVGQAVVEILIGKGIGKAGGILAKTKTGAKLLEDASQLKNAGVLKIAETFSDEAAGFARQRLQRKLATQLYSGIPVDALADLAVVAGNRIGRGTVKFADFSRLMVQEFGDRIKPHLEKLYRDAMDTIGRKFDDVEIKNVDLNNIRPRSPITAANIGTVIVPGVRGGEFASWFNSLNRAEMGLLWSNKALRETVENRLRHPGGFHEWLPVSRAPKFKEWGITAEQIWTWRSETKTLRFVNPPGRHGGVGSGTAHNELFALIDRANSFAEFKTLLRDWASRRLPNGVNDLPPGLR